MTDRKIIGYVPIYEPQPGAIVTRAFILCSRCMKAISAHGGPRHEALCLDCVHGKDATVLTIPEFLRQ